jgi:hypothetical protein
MPASGNQPPRRRGPPQDTGPTFQESLVDAQNRRLDFPATERATYVRAMVKRTLDYKAEGRSLDDIKVLLPEFVRDYPHLFEMVTQSEGYDSASLQTMLAMLDRMGQGSLNQHQATVIVGERLAKKYIKKEDQ